MQKKILQELIELKALISKLIGTSDLPSSEQFSKDAIEKAAKQFQKLKIERGEWVSDWDLYKIFKDANRAGTYIRQQFGFSNYFKKGHSYYYNKKDLIALSQELKKRNVDLGRYIEYLEDKEKFKKYIQGISQNNQGKKKKKAFELPEDLRDISSSPPKPPSADSIKEDIGRLKQEFFQYSLGDYVDIYDSNHAMMKSIYFYQKYLEPDIKKRCKRWCENFNYANHALELVTKKKEVFVPVKEEDMIQL